MRFKVDGHKLDDDDSLNWQRGRAVLWQCPWFRSDKAERESVKGNDTLVFGGTKRHFILVHIAT